MSVAEERKQTNEVRFKEAYSQIQKIAHTTPYPVKVGEQFADFTVGRMKEIKQGLEVADDAISKFRILTDFRGESFSAFIVAGKVLPVEVESFYRRKIFFKAQEAYDFMVQEAKTVNEFFSRFQ